MPRSSESVAALGGALAKAQAKLVNPEKSLTATVFTGGADKAEERTFRYASLASGLDIVRKTLSEFEIATVQTTTVDQAGGLVNLTTMLVHASGEWIASDWPVCPVSDLASPRRMGAALTYARRYALFTLVGIAGEDDLDAPDLQNEAVPRAPSASHVAVNGFAGTCGTVADLGKADSPHTGNGYEARGRRNHRTRPPTVLPSMQSANLRDRLIAEIANLSSNDQEERWARTALPAKNTLVVADAQAVESAFERKVAELKDRAGVDGPPPAPGRYNGNAETDGQYEISIDRSEKHHDRRTSGVLTASGMGSAGELGSLDEDEAAMVATRAQPHGIDKSLLTISEPKRYRNKEHLRFVAQQPCLICDRTPSDPHHVRFAQQRALGRKVSDEFVVPLCRTHHRALHRVGNEMAWWKATGIDPLQVASKLWGHTRQIEQSEPVPAAPGFLHEAAEPRPGLPPSSSTPRRDARRVKKRGSAQSATNSRMP